MVKLKLQRIGRKKTPHFRLIVQESSKDPWDKSNEILGWINPRSKEKELKKERIEYWLSVGAQPTDTVQNLLINEGIIKGDKSKTINISKKRAEKLASKDADKSQMSTDNSDKKVEEAKPEGEAPKEEKKEEVPAEEVKEEKVEEKKEEESK